jgi:hypothetical protein
VNSDIELRVTLGRLLVHLQEMEDSARAARALVQAAVVQIDANRTERLPPARDMIVAVLQPAGAGGLARTEIIAAVHRDYGVHLQPNTATTTLLRMQQTGLVWREGRFWVLA